MLKQKNKLVIDSVSREISRNQEERKCQTSHHEGQELGRRKEPQAQGEDVSHGINRRFSAG